MRKSTKRILLSTAILLPVIFTKNITDFLGNKTEIRKECNNEKLCDLIDSNVIRYKNGDKKYVNVFKRSDNKYIIENLTTDQNGNHLLHIKILQSKNKDILEASQTVYNENGDTKSTHIKLSFNPDGSIKNKITTNYFNGEKANTITHNYNIDGPYSEEIMFKERAKGNFDSFRTTGQSVNLDSLIEGLNQINNNKKIPIISTKFGEEGKVKIELI